MKGQNRILPLKHPWDWIAHLILGFTVTWFSLKVLKLERKPAFWMGVTTVLTVEAAQIESGIWQREDHAMDIIYGTMGVGIALELGKKR